MPIRFVAFDMDGTLVETQSSWAWVHQKFGESNDEGLQQFLRGEIDDEEFIRSDIRIWWRHRPSLAVRELREILASVPLMPGAHELFRGLHNRGVRTAIISGGIDLLADRIARELGISEALANGFETDPQGRLTGAGIVRVPIQSKENVLASLQRRWDISPEQSAAVGNSDIDVGLFRRARVRVAFLPVDERIRAHATHRVETKDLSLLLPILTEEPGDSSAVSAAPPANVRQRF
jgi:phosphoserine phosphatase